MSSPDSPRPHVTPPQLALPWPALCEGPRLFILAMAPGGRSQSLGRFLGAAFVAFGLLLLLVGTQKALPPALAGGGACIFAGVGLLAAVRRGAAPLLLLDGENGTAILCRRRLGGRAFRAFPLETLEWTASPDGRHVSIHPLAKGPAGREIPALPSRISDRGWRQGMTLPTPTGEAGATIAALKLWQSLARQGEAPAIPDACDSDEFSALMGKKLPAALLSNLDGSDTTLWQAGKEEDRDEAPERPLRDPIHSAEPHPEIRRAPDLRESSARRDKRD
ncbi:MAG: hypothetical protein HDR50_11620 [Desulfovibrio sp.]|uniref:hypothetical protein n=1 Tax=Desulfovibrio sp. TaxID=885 RepID=UPI001A6A7ABC|nr:hypothetical protein [Desulfovibrio sp.]MBD5418261.1 hypothetical protein [Desulfovibrio sp.]